MLVRVRPSGRMRRPLAAFAAVAAFAMLALVGPSAGPSPAVEQAQAGTTPAGFQDTVVFSGLTNPTVVRFAVDGRVFVAEKSGLIKVFDSLTDPTPTVFADLRTNVHNFWDRGLLGMALAPELPDRRRTSTSSTRTTTCSGRRPRRLGHTWRDTTLPDPARRRPRTDASSADASRGCRRRETS